MDNASFHSIRMLDFFFKMPIVPCFMPLSYSTNTSVRINTIDTPLFEDILDSWISSKKIGIKESS